MPDAIALPNGGLAHCALESPNFLGNGLGDFGTTIALTFQPSVVSTAETRSVGVAVVVPASDPLKVVNEVVSFDPVLVVHLKGVVTGDECFGHKAMNEDSFPSSLVAQNVLDVSAPGGQGFQYPSHPKSLSATAWQQPAAPTKRTDFVNGFPFRDRSPLFFHGDSLLHSSSLTQLGSV